MHWGEADEVLLTLPSPPRRTETDCRAEWNAPRDGGELPSPPVEWPSADGETTPRVWVKRHGGASPLAVRTTRTVLRSEQLCATLRDLAGVSVLGGRDVTFCGVSLGRADDDGIEAVMRFAAALDPALRGEEEMTRWLHTTARHDKKAKTWRTSRVHESVFA